MWVGLSKYVDMNKIKPESKGKYLFRSKAGPETFKIRTDSVFYSLLGEGGEQALEKIQGALEGSVQHFQLELNNKELKWDSTGLVPALWTRQNFILIWTSPEEFRERLNDVWDIIRSGEKSVLIHVSAG